MITVNPLYGVIGFVYLALVVWSLLWVFRDAEERGKNGFLAALFVFFAGWPISILWWRWLRPQTKTGEKATS